MAKKNGHPKQRPAESEFSSGASRSVWDDTDDVFEVPRLEEDLEADVCVVGAGMAGMSVAYMLSEEGLSVVVLDDGPPGGGETSRTTAHLTNVLDQRYHSLERMHGERGARIAAESHAAAIDKIAAIAAEEDIDCELERVDGYLFVPPGDPQDPIERELEAARRAGVSGVSVVPRAPFPQFESGRCLRFPNQARFQPLLYLYGLGRAIKRAGGAVRSGAHVEAIETEGSPRVKVEGGRQVRAKDVVVATNSPVNTMVRIHTKQAPYRTYAIAASVPRGWVTDALYYDMPWPYHYVRLLPALSSTADDLLIVGGEDHKTGQKDDASERYARLEAWARERFPRMGNVERRWSGQVMQPVDGLGYIGRDKDSEHVYIVTGDSGMGMTHSTIAGILITDLIQGRGHPWADLYDPGRVTLQAAGDYLKENVNVAAQYADHLTPGEVASVEDIALGAGAVVREGMRKIAVYREPGGALHALSAICPHLGCVVAWNSAERTWDCPCHGSRFDPNGQVLNGPAVKALEPAEIHAHKGADD